MKMVISSRGRGRLRGKKSHLRTQIVPIENTVQTLMKRACETNIPTQKEEVLSDNPYPEEPIGKFCSYGRLAIGMPIYERDDGEVETE